MSCWLSNAVRLMPFLNAEVPHSPSPGAEVVVGDPAAACPQPHHSPAVSGAHVGLHASSAAVLNGARG